MFNNIKNRILKPVMIPEQKTLKYHNKIGFYYLVIPAEVIKFYWNKFHSGKMDIRNIIQQKKTIMEGVKLSDSFLINNDNRQSLPLEFQDLPNGTWMIEIASENPDLLIQYENIGLKGFYIEGNYTIEGEDGNKYNIQEDYKRMNNLSDLLFCKIWGALRWFRRWIRTRYKVIKLFI